MVVIVLAKRLIVPVITSVVVVIANRHCAMNVSPRKCESSGRWKISAIERERERERRFQWY